MKELQKNEYYHTLTKYKKHFNIDNSTKSKVGTIIRNIYELLKTGIIFCLFVLFLREPTIIRMILAPTIIIASAVLKIIGIIVLIFIVFNFLT